MIYTREHAREVLPMMMTEFRGWDAESISQALEFIIKGMSRDGTFSETVLHDAVNEEKARLNIKKEIPLSQVADLEPLRRVVREVSR
jgi:hypothetical protein